MSDELITHIHEAEHYGVLLISLYFSSSEASGAEASLEELRQLAETALAGDDVITYYKMTQCRPSPEAATYIGEGKAKEAGELCANEDIRLAIFDCELSPSQIRNLENLLSEGQREVRVIDRTMLILDIFAAHAVTGEGKLQVEIAQLKYTAPRLTGRGVVMSRQGGTSSSGSVGARGPGETKLETDRRHIHRRIESLEASLKELENTRDTMRHKRARSGIPNLAIVGYTNAGKSTLLNYLTGAGILAEDKLFATLDPTVRHLTLPSGLEILLTDTVGFISHLPHGLVKAFKSTLDEAKYADMLLLLLDASDEAAAEKTRVTEETLAELGAGDKPIIYVFNKCDRLTAVPGRETFGDRRTVCISAATGEGIDELLALIEQELTGGLHRVTFCFPFGQKLPLDDLYRLCTVNEVRYTESGAEADVLCDDRVYGMYRDYILAES